MSEKKLSGRTALITGASKGLGRAMALSLGASGAKLALVSRNLEQTRATAESARKLGAEAEVFQADVTDEQQVARLEKEVSAKFGKIQILINNAGINIRKLAISKIPLARWGKVEEVGQLAVYLCSEEAGFITGTDVLMDGGWTAQ